MDIRINQLLFFTAFSALLFGCGDNTNSSNDGTGGIGGQGGSGQSGVQGGSGQAGSGTLLHIDRSQAYLTDLGTDKSLDYKDQNLWICRPDIDINECTREMDAIEIKKDGTQVPVPLAVASNPSFDCFYVYPTVLLTRAGNQTDFSDSPDGARIVLDPLRSQAAPFTRICSVYAPLYRQIGIPTTGAGSGLAEIDGGVAGSGEGGAAGTIATAGTGGMAAGGGGATAGSAGAGGATGTTTGASPAASRAFADVTDAFEYYLANLSKGRNFVLIGHSQGSAMLTTLIRTKIDNDPALLSRMISALIIGGGVTVAAGQNRGASFQNIPTCASSADTGCVVHYRSFAKEVPPAGVSAAGSATLTPGVELACTEPGRLSGNTGNYRGSYIATRAVLSQTFTNDLGGTLPTGVNAPFLIYRDMFKGECKTANGINYLEISVAKTADDTRSTPPYRSSIVESVGSGMHLMDFNLPIDDLIDLVSKQAAVMPKK
jgi:hypothetical protein